MRVCMVVVRFIPTHKLTHTHTYIHITYILKYIRLTHSPYSPLSISIYPYLSLSLIHTGATDDEKSHLRTLSQELENAVEKQQVCMCVCVFVCLYVCINVCVCICRYM